MALSTIFPYATITTPTGEYPISNEHDVLAGPPENEKVAEVMSQLEKQRSAHSGSDRKSGRAVFDEGRTVWEWQTATGVFERHVSDEQLARLENASLQLVDQGYEGRAIYGETGSQTAYNARKQVFVGRPAPVRSAQTGTLRQFWRRLLPST